MGGLLAPKSAPKNLWCSLNAQFWKVKYVSIGGKANSVSTCVVCLHNSTDEAVQADTLNSQILHLRYDSGSRANRVVDVVSVGAGCKLHCDRIRPERVRNDVRLTTKIFVTLHVFFTCVG